MLVKALPIHGLGGLEKHTLDLSLELSKRGHKVYILTFAHPKGRTEEILNENLKIYYLPCNIQESVKNQNRKFTRKLKDLMTKYDIDLIHSQSTIVHLIDGYEELKIPIVVTYHGFWYNSFKTRLNRRNLRGFLGAFLHLFRFLLFRKRIYDKLLIEADSIIVISNESKVQFEHYKPELKSKINLIYNGIDTQRFMPTSPTEVLENLGLDKGPKLIYTGRLAEEKGLQNIIEIAPELIKNYADLKIILIGTGPYKQNLDSMVKKLKIEEHILFLGFIPNEKLHEYLSLGDIYVFPSQALEGLPISLIEAMASSLPIVASRSGGIQTLIKNNYNGLLFEPGRPKKLLNKIEYLLDNPKIAQKLGQKAREDAIKHYSKESMVSKTIDVYYNTTKKGK